MYQATAATAPTYGPWLRPSGVDRSMSIRYPAQEEGGHDGARRPIGRSSRESLVHDAQRSPGAIPAVCSPQRAHGD